MMTMATDGIFIQLIGGFIYTAGREMNTKVRLWLKRSGPADDIAGRNKEVEEIQARARW